MTNKKNIPATNAAQKPRIGHAKRFINRDSSIAEMNEPMAKDYLTAQQRRHQQKSELPDNGRNKENTTKPTCPASKHQA